MNPSKGKIMTKDVTQKSINTLRHSIDGFINNYEEFDCGCGYNIGAESRRRAKAEKIRKALEEKTKAAAELDESSFIRMAG